MPSRSRWPRAARGLFHDALPSALLCAHTFRSLSKISAQDLRDLHPASLPRREDAGAHHRKRSRRVLAPDFVPTLSANSRGKLLQLLDQGVIRCALDRCGLAFAALEKTEPVVQIVVGGGV